VQRHAARALAPAAFRVRGDVDSRSPSVEIHLRCCDPAFIKRIYRVEQSGR
jgi:hypothetical protein